MGSMERTHTTFIISRVGREDVQPVYLVWQVTDSDVPFDENDPSVFSVPAADGTNLYAWWPDLMLSRHDVDKKINEWMMDYDRQPWTYPATVIDLTAGPLPVYLSFAPEPVVDPAKARPLPAAFGPDTVASLLAREVFDEPLDVNAGPIITVCALGHQARWSTASGGHWKHIIGESCRNRDFHAIPLAKFTEIRRRVMKTGGDPIARSATTFRPETSIEDHERRWKVSP